MLVKVQKISNWLKKLVPLLVFIDLVLALTVGYYHPHLVKSLRALITPAILLLLIPMMMGLVIEEIKLVFRDKKVLAIAMMVNFIIYRSSAFYGQNYFLRGLNPNSLWGGCLN